MVSADWVDRLQRSRRGVEVVLADEDHRRALHGGEIQHFVEGAVIAGAVAEKRHADIVATLLAALMPAPVAWPMPAPTMPLVPNRPIDLS